MGSIVNKKLARIFKEMAAIYAFTNGENRFRSLAYEKASRILSSMEEDIGILSEKEMEALQGIGHGIATKIEEFIATGKIKKYEELKAGVPFDIVELSEISGFGPKTLKKIYEELGTSTKKELISALHDGRISQLRGFGKRKVENMLKGLKLHRGIEERILLWEALEISDRILGELNKLPEIRKLEIAGSIRRGRETIGDLDILATCKKEDQQKVVEYFTNLSGVKEILAKGETKASIIIDDKNRQVDLRVLQPDEWGSAMVYFTGSKQHNVHIRSIAKNKNLKVSEYGVFNIGTGKKIAGKTEEDVYKALGMQWMPAEMREDTGEVELSLKHKIPRLVTIEDIRGDLQMHTTRTDGMHTLKEIAEFVKSNYKYEYIGVTDHSQAVRIAGGIGPKEFLKQRREIREINEKLGRNFVKAGIEVDINTDGSLDMTDEVLRQMDWVVASIHTHFNRDNTDRLIKACENPFVNVIGHPTGRLMGSREPYRLNLEELIAAAKETGTALEINAQPERMDLSDQQARLARAQGVKLAISSDAHTFSNFAFMKMGVIIARRAWCTDDDIINTWTWNEIRKFFAKKRKETGTEVWV